MAVTERRLSLSIGNSIAILEYSESRIQFNASVRSCLLNCSSTLIPNATGTSVLSSWSLQEQINRNRNDNGSSSFSVFECQGFLFKKYSSICLRSSAFKVMSALSPPFLAAAIPQCMSSRPATLCASGLIEIMIPFSRQ